MTRAWLILGAAASMFRVCGRDPASSAPTIAAMGAPPAMIAEHGGALAVSAGLVTEVSPLPDGRIVAYVRDPNRQAVQPNEVDVSVRRPDGTLEPVAVAYDPQLQGYVGRPTGLPAGQYPIEVSVRAAPALPPVQLITPPVAVAATPIPPARYGGRVEIVGDNVVETVVARDGNIAMYWTDMNGNAIAPAEVQVPSMTVTVNGTPHAVVPRIEGDHYVGHIPAAPVATVSVAAPGVVVRGMRYRRVYAPVTPVVAVMPAAVVVGPQVVVAPPVVVAPAVIAPPVVVAGPGVVYGGHYDNGHHYGHWGRGGVVVGGPSVVVGAPGVVVGGPGIVVGGRGHWHGGGGGWGHGHHGH